MRFPRTSGSWVVIGLFVTAILLGLIALKLRVEPPPELRRGARPPAGATQPAGVDDTGAGQPSPPK